MTWITLTEALVLAAIGEAQLIDALLPGDVRGRVRFEDRSAKELPPAAWRRDIDWAGSRLDVAALFQVVLDAPTEPRFLTVEIDRQTLLDHFGGATKAAKKVAGRPPTWNWEEFWLELCARAYEDGLPARQIEMVKRMEQWFVNERGDHPAESEIKKRVSRLWHRLGLG